MLAINVPTLSIVSSAIDMLIMLFLFHALATRKTYSGFKEWVLSAACWAFGSLLTLVLRGKIHIGMSIVVGSIFIMLHPALLYEGFSKFYSQHRRWSGTFINIALLIIGLMVHIYFYVVNNSDVMRAVNISIILGLLFLHTAIAPLFIHKARHSILQWLLSVVLICLSALLLYRSQQLMMLQTLDLLNDRLLCWLLFYGIGVELVLFYTCLALTSDRVERELRESEERFRHLSEGSADLVWQLDLDLHVTYVNHADYVLRGFTPEEVLGTSVFDVFTATGAALIWDANRERLAQEELGIKTGAARYELELLCKDGGLIWGEVHANPLRNKEGVITGYIAVIRDIGARKRDEQRLAEALAGEQRARSEQDRFLDMISHEYRTPLAIIQTNVDILEVKDRAGQFGLSGYLQKMQRAIERLLDIFEATRRRKGCDHRLLNPVPTRVDPTECFKDIVQTAYDLWGNRFDAHCHVNAGCMLQIDPHLLRIALLNLLDNAVKYSVRGSFVSVRFEQGDGTLQVQVVNQAAQALPSDLRSLFAKYCRGPNSVGISGTGVGLYLVDAIARQYGGSLQLVSDQNEVVTATMTVPLDC